MARGRKTGGGSRKGSPNKSSVAAREALAQFVDGNAPRLQKWLDEVASGVRDPANRKKFIVRPDPRKAFEMVTALVEYHVPKLNRTELTGLLGGPIQTSNKTAAVVAEATDADAMRSYMAMLNQPK